METARERPLCYPNDPSFGKPKPPTSPLSSFSPVFIFLEPSSNELQCLKLCRAWGLGTGDVLLTGAGWPGCTPPTWSLHSTTRSVLTGCPWHAGHHARLGQSGSTGPQGAESALTVPLLILYHWPPFQERHALPVFQCSLTPVACWSMPSSCRPLEDLGQECSPLPSPPPAPSAAHPTLCQILAFLQNRSFLLPMFSKSALLLCNVSGIDRPYWMLSFAPQ